MSENTKTYVNERAPSFVTHYTGPNGKRVQILFVKGEFTTADPSAVKFIESLHAFKTGVIRVKSSEAIEAEAKAKAEHLEALKPHAEAIQKAAEDAIAKAEAKTKADQDSAKAQAEAEKKRRDEHDRIVAGIVSKEKAKAKADAEAAAATAAADAKSSGA